MKDKTKILKRIRFAVCICMIWIGCANNPLFRDPDMTQYNAIQGQVRLFDHDSHEKVLVWLEVLNIFTQTDHGGNFSLLLPSPSKQPGGGITGLYPLYFYMTNYRLDSILVSLDKGSLIYNAADLDELGHLKSVKTLYQFLKISTTITPSTMSTTYSDSIWIEMNFEIVRDNGPAEIVFFEYENILTSYIIKSGDNSFTSQFISHIGGGDKNKWLFDYTAQPRADFAYLTKWPLLADSTIYVQPRINLSAGQYEWIPYLIVQSGNIPMHIWVKLKQTIESINDYRDYPIQRNGGIFTIE